MTPKNTSGDGLSQMILLCSSCVTLLTLMTLINKYIHIFWRKKNQSTKPSLFRWKGCIIAMIVQKLKSIKRADLKVWLLAQLPVIPHIRPQLKTISFPLIEGAERKSTIQSSRVRTSTCHKHYEINFVNLCEHCCLKTIVSRACVAEIIYDSFPKTQYIELRHRKNVPCVVCLV